MPVTCTVRMYRLGRIGDCFLLTFTSGEKQDAKVCRVLIDFGAYNYGAGVKDRLCEVATNIQNELLADGQDAKLDVVAATHQHQDHVSGFAYFDQMFAKAGSAAADGSKVAVDNVWLSWLDDPNDQRAATVAASLRGAVRKLKRAAELVGRLGVASHFQGVKKRLGAIVRFDGIEIDPLAAADSNGPKTPQHAYDVLKQLAGRDVSYLRPGTICPLPGWDMDEVRVYVLGPPTTEAALRKMDPSADEAYDPKLAALTFDLDTMLNALEREVDPGAPLAASGDDASDFLRERYFPFDEDELARRDRDARGADDPKTAEIKAYYEQQKWRKIDGDWADQLEQLAIYLNDYTNNSSLVLAFELVSSGKVLLFAADAQAGNWKSWQDIKWSDGTKNLQSLLSRVVLYKVGHHASRNATYKPWLEQMTSPDLLALIPVDQANADSQGWKMPAKQLYEALKTHARGRVIRMDDGLAALQGVTWPDYVETEETDLYVDVKIQDKG